MLTKNNQFMILGKSTAYKDKYDNNLLCSISRNIARKEIDISYPLPFVGFDIWNCYELSWLGIKGKPEVRILELVIKADSENIVESKSLKYYLNSFNNTKFQDDNEVKCLIEKDLSNLLKSSVLATIKRLEDYNNNRLSLFRGQSLDMIDIEIQPSDYNKGIDRGLLHLSDGDVFVEESLHSNLLKSNCLVTGQPDFASVQISYKGKKIDQTSLLKYLISFRNHNEFHEQCVERIWGDIHNICAPKELTVYARYTRRGGIDINPVRSSYTLGITSLNNLRHVRQ
jgi:7-cyano-7-deazaguanine reductase